MIGFRKGRGCVCLVGQGIGLDAKRVLGLGLGRNGLWLVDRQQRLIGAGGLLQRIDERTPPNVDTRMTVVSPLGRTSGGRLRQALARLRG